MAIQWLGLPALVTQNMASGLNGLTAMGELAMELSGGIATGYQFVP